MKKYEQNSIELLKSKLKDNNGHIGQGIITFLNPYSYLFYRKNKELFSYFDSIGLDGELLVLMLNVFVLKKKSRANRLSFDMTSFAPILFNKCILEKKSVYFIGSSEENIQRFINEITKNYPQLNIAGYRNGYFSNTTEREDSMDIIISLNPHYAVIGMGSPYQERYLVDLKLAGFSGVGYSCGGFIHQTAKKLDYYPKFYDKYNLRWMFRIYDEPKLLKRYFFYYPLSLCLFIFDFLKYKLGK